MYRIPLIQRHGASPDGTAASKQKDKDKDKVGKAAAKQKESDDQPLIQDNDERLLTDMHAQAVAAVDKIVRSTAL